VVKYTKPYPPPGCAILGYKMRRQERLVTGEVYHIFNKSIAGFKIFYNDSDFSRMRNMLRYYHIEGMLLKFSRFIELETVEKYGFNKSFISDSEGKRKLVQIIAYCLMPTHVHLILKQLKKDGISIFMSNVLNSYSRYFNIKHKRKGPLWEGRFKNVLIETDEQLLHLTRYIHLNPVTSYLVDNPDEWTTSSYKEYLLKVDDYDCICEYGNILNITPVYYKRFVEDSISYQRELAKIKKILLE